MVKTIRKIWNRISAVIAGLAALMIIVLVGSRITGLRPYVVMSGSMEPAYSVGSLVFVKSADYKELKVGDPITYRTGQDVTVTHRIIEILSDEEDSDTLRFRTKGDANDIPDGMAVHYKNIIGKPIFVIPYLGYVSHYIKNPPGIYIIISVCAISGFFIFLSDILQLKC